jgi:TetR/AcrR family transcriptional repressor of mexJK operon
MRYLTMLASVVKLTVRYGQKTVDKSLLKVTGRDARRQAILDIARDVFMKDGFAAASMSSIAALLGGSKATLYNYFSSKEELFIAMIEDQCERNHPILFDFDPEDGVFVEVLRRLGERFVRLMISDDIVAMHRLVIAEASRFPELGRTLYEAGPKRGHARLSAFLREAMPRNGLHADDVERAAAQLMDLCLADLYRQRLWNVRGVASPAEIGASVDYALATFLTAYRTPQCA